MALVPVVIVTEILTDSVGSIKRHHFQKMIHDICYKEENRKFALEIASFNI